MNCSESGNSKVNNDCTSAMVTRATPYLCDATVRSRAAVILNADDWGRDESTTDRSLDCVHCGAVSSVSTMMFMRDSKRAAQLAREHGIDAGLHLNFTLPFSGPQCSSRLNAHQQKLARVLKSHRLAPVLYYPSLAASFEYVIQSQLEEYERLYGAPARRIDGHHHMHLCANVVLGKLLPEGVCVRRNLSFMPGEKGYLNRVYRRWQDRVLARRHHLADFFFDLQPIEPRCRLQRICELAVHSDIEIETHPIRDEDFRLLMSGELARLFGEVVVARGYNLRFRGLCGGIRSAA
jgi:YdjC-like protein